MTEWGASAQIFEPKLSAVINDVSARWVGCEKPEQERNVRKNTNSQCFIRYFFVEWQRTWAVAQPKPYWPVGTGLLPNQHGIGNTSHQSFATVSGNKVCKAKKKNVSLQSFKVKRIICKIFSEQSCFANRLFTIYQLIY